MHFVTFWRHIRGCSFFTFVDNIFVGAKSGGSTMIQIAYNTL